MEAIENPNNKTLDEALKEKSKNKKKVEKIRVVGCKECGMTNVTLIKATDSYYCKFCFNKLKKDKFKKGKY